MAEYFSFLILSSSGNTVKRTHCSHRILYALFGALILSMSILAIGAADYIRIYRKDLNNKELEAELLASSQELIYNRRQIRKFAREINHLKNCLVELNQMDRRLRRVAGMEQSEGLFGIGGSAPEDLHPDLELKRKRRQLVVEMHQQVKELGDAAVYQQNSFNDLWKVVQTRGKFMAYTPTIQPAEGWISSSFGYRKSPFTGKREFHHGLDIANDQNTEVNAAADGCIYFAGERRGFGRLVVIDHGHGLKTLYAHLSQILKRHGEMVKRDETIAYMGNTGRSTGTHLHYEVRLNGLPVNPQKYILN